jgi:hypothetical protein
MRTLTSQIILNIEVRVRLGNVARRPPRFVPRVAGWVLAPCLMVIGRCFGGMFLALSSIRSYMLHTKRHGNSE